MHGSLQQGTPSPLGADRRVFVTGGSGFVGGQLLRRLVASGASVRALARSPAAAQRVAQLGAQPVAGDLAHPELLAAGMAGCQLVFHAAAKTNEWDAPSAFWATNVAGTRNLLAACRRAAVPRLVHVSSEAVLADGRPLDQVDEQAPYARWPQGLYAASKQLGEQAVLAASCQQLATVVVRPRLVWGVGDRALLPGLLATMRQRRWIWWGDGQQPTSTCHIDNLCEGLLAAAQHGRAGEVYFLTDGHSMPIRDFFEGLVRTQGVEPRAWRLPRALAPPLVRVGESLWRRWRLPGSPPLEATTLALTFTAVTLDDSKARRELGYRARVSPAAGLQQLRQAHRAPRA